MIRPILSTLIRLLINLYQYVYGCINLFETIKFIRAFKRVRHFLRRKTIFIYYIIRSFLDIIRIRMIKKPGADKFSIPGPVVFTIGSSVNAQKTTTCLYVSFKFLLLRVI